MEDKELLFIMEKCGHFLYHRRGGKRGQLRILRLLTEHGTITQKELLEVLTLKSGSVSEMVGKLETQGFITKERSDTDKRKINITLTDEGRTFLAEKTELMQKQEEVLFDSLTAGQREILKELLSTLLQDWENKFDSSLFAHKGGL